MLDIIDGLLRWLDEDPESWSCRAVAANLGYLSQFADQFARRPLPDLHEREIAFYAFLWHPLHAGRKTSAAWMAQSLRETYRFLRAEGFTVSFPSGITRKSTSARYDELKAVVAQQTGRQAAFLGWARRWPEKMGAKMLIGKASQRTPDPRTTDEALLTDWLREFDAIPQDQLPPMPPIDRRRVLEELAVGVGDLGCLTVEGIETLMVRARRAAYASVGLDPYADDDIGLKRMLDERLLGEE